MLGASFGSAQRLKRLFAVLTVVGVVLGVLTILEKLGWDVKGENPYSKIRPSGIFVNSNRLAVMEALCASCGLGLLLASCVEQNTGWNDGGGGGSGKWCWGWRWRS